MNKHLKLVREHHQACSFKQAKFGEIGHVSDMEIIIRQAMLMEAASLLFNAIKSGEMVEILSGLVNLSYVALGAVAVSGEDVTESSLSWQHDGYVISIVRLMSDKIGQCANGNPNAYSEVYQLCVLLTRNFLNADFDKAFQVVHDHHMKHLSVKGVSIYEDAWNKYLSELVKQPNLDDCLYE